MRKRHLPKCFPCRNGSAKPAAMWLTTRTKASKPERLRRSNAIGSALRLRKRCGGAGLRWRPLITIAIRSTDRAGRRDHNIRCWFLPILTRERCTTILFFSRCVCETAKNMTATSASITVCGSCPMRCAAARG